MAFFYNPKSKERRRRHKKLFGLCNSCLHIRGWRLRSGESGCVGSAAFGAVRRAYCTDG